MLCIHSAPQRSYIFEIIKRIVMGSTDYTIECQNIIDSVSAVLNRFILQFSNVLCNYFSVIEKKGVHT